MKVAVAGDNFMLASAFSDALQRRVSTSIQINAFDLPFPNKPVVQRSDDPLFAEIREFQGSADRVINAARDAEAFITHVAPLTKHILDELPALKFVGVSRGGPVNVDRSELGRRGIRLVNTPGRNASAVAEFTIGVLLSETRNICYSHASMKQNTWRGDLYRADVQRKELSEMTVGLIGYSHIGKRVGQLLKAFFTRILVADPYITLDESDRQYGIEQLPLEALLPQCDAVSLHLPATAETNGLFGRETLAKMKPGAVLINTSRGSLIDENALAAALQSGHLSGAALDTYQTEPLPGNSPLLALDNVLFTSHIAGASYSTVTIAADMIAEELRRFIDGEPPLNPVAT
jgi:D-3-phosphoglycerate dehydrogenase